MTEEIKRLQEERQLIKDQLFSNKIPNRLSCEISFNQMYLMEWKGINPLEGQFNYSVIKDAAHELCESIFTDSSPVAGVGISSRLPLNMQLLDSKTMVMGASGFMQHPNVKGMEADEYDKLLADPYAFLAEYVVPRLYPGFTNNNAVMAYRNITMSDAARAADAVILNGMNREFSEEFGYYKGAPAGSGGFTAAPFDFLADQVRSFSEIVIDVRRNRQAVKDACEALLPLMFKLGMPSNPHPNGEISTPLHMAMFMRKKDVEELWLPTYKILCEQLAARGVRVSCFCEASWDNLFDIIEEFPTGQHLRFEKADMKTVKERFGKKYMIGTNFPIDKLRYDTKEECISATRKMLDDTMTGGGITFGFDKGNFTYGGINFENAVAVMDTVHEYGVYKNGGETSSLAPLNSEHFVPDSKFDEPIKSKYSFNWDEFHKKYPMVPEEHVRKRLEKDDVNVMKKYLMMLT